MAPQQNELPTFESHGGLEVDKSSSSLNLKAKVLALGFLLATVGAFVGLSGGFSSAKTSLTESANILNSDTTCNEHDCCDDEERLYGKKGVGQCSVLRAKSEADIDRICNGPARNWATARDVCHFTCDVCPEVCVCENGIAATGDECFSSGDNTCASCESTAFLNVGTKQCIAHKVCEAWQHQTVAPSETQDRECADNVCKCEVDGDNSFIGVAATGQDCPHHDFNKCTSCSGDFHLSGHVCEAWTVCNSNQYETEAGTPTEDRECADKECYCENGEAAEKGTDDCVTDGEEICLGCSGDYFLSNEKKCQAWKSPCADGTVEVQEPNNSRDRLCRASRAPACADKDNLGYGPKDVRNCDYLRSELEPQEQREVCAVVDNVEKTANDICPVTCDSCPEDCEGATAVFCNRVDTCTWTTGSRGCSDGNRGKCDSCVDCEEAQCSNFSGCRMGWVKGHCTQD